MKYPGSPDDPWVDAPLTPVQKCYLPGGAPTTTWQRMHPKEFIIRAPNNNNNEKKALSTSSTIESYAASIGGIPAFRVSSVIPLKYNRPTGPADVYTSPTVPPCAPAWGVSAWGSRIP